jgi:integrase/recombinase XerD
MKKTFGSPIAGDLKKFILFKRNQGYRYNRSEFTLRDYDRFISKYFSEHKRPFKLDEATLAWLAIRPHRKARSVSSDMAVIKKFWDFLHRRHPNRYRREMPWPKLPTESHFTPYIFSDNEIREILKQITRKGGAYDRIHLRMVFLVLYCTGLRFGETVRLRICDVDFGRRAFFITESKGRSRWVPFHCSLARELRKYLKVRNRLQSRLQHKEAPFFLRDQHRPPSVKWISDSLREIFREMGIKPPHGRVGPRPYDVRHCFAVHRLTRWYRQGVDLQARLPWLSAYMGHVNLAGTETYLTATPELLSLAAHRFNRRFQTA